MLITTEEFFCDYLDGSFPGLEYIGRTFQQKGLAAAEKQLADAVRRTNRKKDYLTMFGNDASERILAEAEENVRGNLISTGYRYQFPDGVIDWEANPTPLKYNEWTWQMNRHPGWTYLAHAYRATGDERYAEAFVSQILSWIDQAKCPLQYSGYGTKCWRTIEAGLRMTDSWSPAFFSFLDSPAMTDHAVTAILMSVWEHGWRLTGSMTSHNWLMMEMAGLFYIGVLFPYLKKAEEWRDTAVSVLTRELDTQFYPDGGQYELTPGYQEVVIGSYRDVLELAKTLRVPLPEALTSGYARAFDYYGKLRRPDGTTPAVNDSGASGVASVMNLGLRYFPEREDFRWFATMGKEGSAPSYTDIALPYSGMAAMRTGWGKDDFFVFFESAPFGMAHQHEDKLNVIVYACGKDLLPDTGTYAYDTSEMRKFALDTRSHNCGMVDDLSQNRRSSYQWHAEDITKRSDLRWGFTEDVSTAEGIYNEGFGPKRIPVTHRRKVIFFKKGLRGSEPFVVVIDRMNAEDGGLHTLSVHYQLTREPYTAKGCIVTQDFGGVKLNLISSDEPSIVIAQKEPFWMGWRPKHEAGGLDPEHYPAPCVRYPAENASEHRFASILYPTKADEPAVCAVRLSPKTDDTRFTLIFRDGAELELDEKDYPADDEADRLCTRPV